tara:strand:+ start:182 stop:481 length:300 start_codon:yes stop_codon:yes gene_type:complete
MLIIGTEDLGQLITRYIINSSKFMFLPLGIINTNPINSGRSIHGIPILGTVDDAISIIKMKNISYVINTISKKNHDIKRIENYCKKNAVKYKNANIDLD